MLPSTNKVDRRGIELLFEEGSLLNSPLFAFKFLRIDKVAEPRVSFIVSKKIAKLAVDRNLLRRRGYVALGRYFDLLPKGIIAVFIFKKYEEDLSILTAGIQAILNRLR